MSLRGLSNEDLLSGAALGNQEKTNFNKKLDNINMAKDIASNVGVGAYGLAQLLKGRKLLRNLRPPNAPQGPAQNSTLGSMLSDMLTKSRQADPRFLSQALGESERYKMGRDSINRATSGGSAGIYNALNQADAIRAAELNLTGLNKAEDNKLQHGRLAQFLLQQQMSDDWKRADFDYQKFKDVDLEDFRDSRDYAGELTNRGTEHLFSGIKDGLSFLSPLLKNNQMQTSDGKTDAGDGDFFKNPKKVEKAQKKANSSSSLNVKNKKYNTKNLSESGLQKRNDLVGVYNSIIKDKNLGYGKGEMKKQFNELYGEELGKYKR